MRLVWLLLLLANGALGANIRFRAPASANISTTSQYPTFSYSPSAPTRTPQTSVKPSAGIATRTYGLGNGTTSSSTFWGTHIPTPHYTCCYINPWGVGVNTWWSSSINITLKTVVTTWHQYNNTLVPGNVSTITAPVNATSLYGTYGWQSNDYTVVSSSPTSTATLTFSESGGSYSTRTATDYKIWTSEITVLNGLPNSLLPDNAELYGQTYVAPVTAATFTQQNLTIHSPTPFLSFGGIGVFTSFPCLSGTWTTQYQCSYSGASHICGTSAIATSTDYDFGELADFNGYYYLDESNQNLQIKPGVVYPFPAGDYSNFNYSAYLMDGHGVQGGGDGPDGSADLLDLPLDFPKFLGSIPSVHKQFAGIGKCTNYNGQGQPTVHVPVNELTATEHTTLTMNGVLGGGASQTKATSEAGAAQSTKTMSQDGVSQETSSVQNEVSSATPTTNEGGSTADVHTTAAAPGNTNTEQSTASSAISSNAVPLSTLANSFAASSEDSGPETSPAAAATSNSVATAAAGSVVSAIQQFTSAASSVVSDAAEGGSSAAANVASLILQGIGAATSQSNNLASATQTQAAGGSDGSIVNSGVVPAAPTPTTATVDFGGSDVGDASNTVMPAASTPSVVTVGSGEFTVVLTQAAGSSAIQVANGGTTLTLKPGSSAELGNQVVSAPLSGGVVLGQGSNAVAVAAAQTQEPETNGGRVVTIGTEAATVARAGQSNIVIMNSKTTATIGAEGPVASFNGQVVSALPNGDLEAQSGSSASAILLHSPSPTVALGSQALTVVSHSNNGAVFADAQTTFTLSASGEAATVQGSTISLAQGGVAVVNGVTTTLPSARSSAGASFLPGVPSTPPAFAYGSNSFTFGGHTITAVTAYNGNDIVQYGSYSTQLTPLGPAVSVGSIGLSEDVNGAIVAFSGSIASTYPASSAAFPATSGVVTIGGQTEGYSRADTYVIVGGKTLVPGSSASLDGETLALNGKTQLVAISSTRSSTLETAPSTTVEATGTSQTAGGSVASPSPTSTSTGTKVAFRSLLIQVCGLSAIVFMFS